MESLKHRSKKNTTTEAVMSNGGMGVRFRRERGELIKEVRTTWDTVLLSPEAREKMEGGRPKQKAILKKQ